MRLTASDIVTLYRPTPCALRVYLRQQGVKGAEPSEFDRVFQRLGDTHEAKHLASLGPYKELSVVSTEQRIQLAAEALSKQIPVIYQSHSEEGDRTRM